MNSSKLTLVLLLIFVATGLSGCVGSKPEWTVRDYLQLITGDRDANAQSLECLTTENYRSTDHPHLLSASQDVRDHVLDISVELRDDPSFRALAGVMVWDTDYEVTETPDGKALVIATVRMDPLKPEDRDRALEIPELPDPIRAVIENDLELSFSFSLMQESGLWKIDSFEFPEVLMPLLDNQPDEQYEEPVNNN